MSFDDFNGRTPMAMTNTRASVEEPALVEAARGGDQAAFERLVETHHRPLHAHCYRMLGSVQDAEDALQETLLAAWRGLGGFEGRSSLRSWLYRIATHACLRQAQRRPPRLLSEERTQAWTDVHNLGDVVEDPLWLEPYPDPGDPASRYQEHENVELAFVAALQHLPANQRAVLILREVLQFSAAEVADALDTTIPAVNSALQRARRTVDTRILAGRQQVELRSLGKKGVEDLVARFVTAWERADVPALLDMLADDARFAMPPLPAWFAGKSDIGRFLTERTFQNPWRLQPITASGQIAFACYRHDPATGRFDLGALNVLTLGAGRIVAMTGFLDPELHRRFRLPEVLTEISRPSR
jgi:RNA polymerase sigma-70 factor (TIGR02960 family)